MTPTLSTLPQTRDATARAAVAAHMAAGHARLGGQVEPRGPLRLFTNPRYPWPFFNCARLGDTVQARDVDGLIRHVTRFYNAAGLRPAWEVSLADAPPNLLPRLAAGGFALDRDETLLVHSFIPPAVWLAPFPLGTTCVPIDEARLDHFISAWRQGFAVSADTNLMVVRDLFSEDLAVGWEFWCAWRDGRPIGTTAALRLGDVTQISNVATLPNERGRGIASALVGHVLSHAWARGGRLAYLHAGTGSAAERLYRRLGFDVLDQTLTYIQDSGGR